jgi:hypothetical protein
MNSGTSVLGPKIRGILITTAPLQCRYFFSSRPSSALLCSEKAVNFVQADRESQKPDALLHLHSISDFPYV